MLNKNKSRYKELLKGILKFLFQRYSFKSKINLKNGDSGDEINLEQ